MQRIMSSRTETTRRCGAGWMWLILMVLSCVIAGCTGGSGSSGFDVFAENAAIERAIDQQDCEVFEGLTICAAGGQPTPTATEGERATPSATATAVEATRTTTPLHTDTVRPTTALFTLTPTPSESGTTPTPTRTGTPPPDGTASATTTPLNATATPTIAARTATSTMAAPTVTPPEPVATATSTAVPIPDSPTPTATSVPSAPQIDTNTSSHDTLPCVPSGPESCTIVFEFSPVGMSASATYRVAVRTRNPDSVWLVVEAPNNRAEISVSTDPGQQYQFAVLVFTTDPAFVPGTVDLLADTGADSAFVTPVVNPLQS